MKCKKLIIFFGMLFSVFFASLFSSSFTYAVDLSYVIDSTNQATQYTLCTTECSNFNYLVIDSVSDSLYLESAYSSFNLFTSNFATRIHPFVSNKIIFVVPSDANVVKYNATSPLNSYFTSHPNASVTLTLTDENPLPSSGVSGSLSITENGTYDVSQYASVDVNIPAEVVQGDYHDDLVNINNSIIICGAVLLVLYFFYCIYRIIIKGGSL